MSIEVDEGERQLIVLALALTALLRPGFDYACREAARNFCGGSDQMYRDFKMYNEGTVKPQTELGA